MNKCNNCEKENVGEVKYCIECGYKLNIIEKVVTEDLAKQKQKIEKKTNTEDNQRTEKLKKLKTTIGFFVGFGIMTFTTNYFFKKPTFDKAMIEISNELNENCPIILDSETRLDNTVVLPNNIFQYNYTLPNMEKEKMNVEEMKNYLYPNMINFVKTTPEMKQIRENNVVVNYNYRDKNNNYLFTISVKPSDYK
jgi:hypothetical protein